MADSRAEPAPGPTPWIGVDLDGTLAYFDAESSLAEIGPPVAAMLAKTKELIASGERVKIFTARAADPGQLPLIRKWLQENSLPPLEITNVKDFYMIRLYDDRSIQVEKNTGRILGDAGGE
ncbi:MAG TPA: hypothetical protein VKO20_06150 [Desulfosalsimonadaceae bacterium]|nr:hypothetical protein [Desulfosalsimonadaceae bacterium]